MTLQTVSDRPGGPGTTAASSIAEALAQMVLHELQPGMNLPSEGELATRFGVSRLTIREAVKMVAGRGLLDLGRGRRAIIIQPSGIAFADYMTTLIRHDPKGLFDLVELRLTLEVQSATLAAKRANRAGIAALEAEMDGMRAAVEDGRSGFDPEESEQRFHQRVQPGFHARDGALVQGPHQDAPQAGVQRRVAEHLARGVVLEKRRADTEFRPELALLV